MKSESPPGSEGKSSDEKRRLARQKRDVGSGPEAGEHEMPQSGEVFEEGDDTVYEDEEGNVLAVEDTH
ncbi:Na+/H+ antiporter, partial [Teratosphaeriaceae sp. CCFEE 6253]